MLAYYLRLALKSLRRNPVLTGLMISAIALGVGLCITTLTVYRFMSGNPLAQRNDVLYAVTMDNWNPNEPYDDSHPELPPPELTYQDAQRLYESGIPKRKVMMRKARFVMEPATHGEDAKPSLLEARLTTKDFFGMFNAPFRYGGGWDEGADAASQLVVVLSQQTNQIVFGGRDSVGEKLRLDGRDYTVIGVLDEWHPTPKVYDLNNGSFDDIEAAFIPYGVGTALELPSGGNTNCWGNAALNSFRSFLTSDCVWIQFWVELEGAANVAAFQDFIDDYVREEKKLGRFERPLNNHLRKPDEWLRINEAVDDDNRILVGLSFMFLAVCMLNTIGLLLAKFLGASSLVGLRRALGANKTAIFHQHLIEVAALGLAGGLSGVGVAAVGLYGMRRLYENYGELTHLDIAMVLMAIGIAVTAALIAGIYPSWRVCRMQPAMYLKTQ